jgi:hypothetical protein
LRHASRITAQQARRGRFAARWHDRRANQSSRRAARLAARIAWRRGLRATYVPWYGAVFLPYVYSDLFYYPFWPQAYDAGFWDYAYDGFFDGIFFPDGAPYATYAYAGPYDSVETSASTTGRSSDASVPGQVSEAAQQLCRQPDDSGVTAWPFDRIEKAVNPTTDQQAMLENLKRAAADASDLFTAACPEHVPMTPTGRLEAMTERQQATLDAVKLIRPPLESFYQSLSDEQQARFNAIGPDIGKKQPKQAPAENQASAGEAQAGCSGDKDGLTSLPIARIDDVVRPTDEQADRLNKLDDALKQAVQTLEAACPNYIPQTPVGRMDVMQQRLEAMLQAANIVRPALEEFYASLDSEQKAQVNRLGRETAQSSQ